ncbi:MAG: Stp1/IreP family PP2C-type Ser/Thr phosphatase [Vicinamibacteraceae bacterium]
MTWDIAGHVVSDVGCVRELNEDRGRIVQPGDDGEQGRRGVLAIVADGMGGHSAGEVASELAVDTVHRAYYERDGAPGEALVAALEHANRTIFETASAERRLAGMGTTCVALAVCDGHAHAASVGDSRLYLLRDGGIYRMTNDDSAVGELVARGLLTRSEARHHADRNVILRALGTHHDVQVSRWDQPLPVRSGDVFVLCSDGLSDLVEDEEIAELVTGQHGAEAAKALVTLARSRGGHDNITVALVRITAHAAEPVAAPATREVRVIR